MKTIFNLLRPILAIVLGCLLHPASAQLSNGGLHANFGVDADTKADYIKYGPRTGSVSSEDWFWNGGAGKGIIDTTNATLYRSLLMQNKNIAFTQRQAAPLYYKNNNTMWIDAVYARDYLKIDALNLDTTGFLSSSKNAEDPSLWVGGPSGISNKNDIMDVYTHMRRNGLNINDSLWLFMAASIVGTTGAKYFDVELFKNNVGYSSTTGAFSTAGPDEGHAAWRFDAAGNIIQTGDLIIACTYNPGSAPVIDVRIWVARTTYSNVVPALFNFGTNSYDANSNASIYGYASIVSKNGSTAFGSGAGNYTASGNDSTYSTPWGSTSKAWQPYYDGLQLVEVGINLTRIGIDPALYGTLGNAACTSFFKSILYKSRSSASFSSNLNDFVGPLDFMRIPVWDHSITADSLSCRKMNGTINITNRSTMPYYNWSSANGNIISVSYEGTTVGVNKGGTYIVKASVASGCAADRTDTVIVPADTSKPIATARAGIDLLSRKLLYGGDPVASNYPTPFGGSQGLAYSWTGPLGFGSTQQNPFISIWGIYNLTVTELRNGCTSSAGVIAEFTPLANAMELKGQLQQHKAVMGWKASAPDAVKFEIEKSLPDAGFVTIGSISALGKTEFSFTDLTTTAGWNTYRIRETSSSGAVQYSTILRLENTTATSPYFTRDAHSGQWFLVITAKQPGIASLQLYNTAGATISRRELQLERGTNNIALGNLPKGIAAIASVQVNGLTSSQKIIF